MEEFIGYLTERIGACKAEAARLEEAGCRDEADFAKVRTNIYEVCRTVTGALVNRPGAGPEAVKAQLERFHTAWSAALETAKAHGDARNTVIEETKLEALRDAAAHFPEG